jgi:hypothetical protein
MPESGAQLPSSSPCSPSKAHVFFIVFGFQNCHAASTSSMVITVPKGAAADHFCRLSSSGPNSDNINAKSALMR